jgi:hypothetical protein
MPYAHVIEGTCGCGCGEPIKRGRRYVRGHQRWLSPHAYVVEDCGYETPCWVWRRGRSANGYATRHGKRRRTCYVHVQLYEEKHGPVPEGLDLDHLCRVRLCVNPDHLEPVTRAVNIQRGAGAKLNMEQAEEIRRLVAAGRPQQTIAAAYGIHNSQVSRIHNRLAWVPA